MYSKVVAAYKSSEVYLRAKELVEVREVASVNSVHRPTLPCNPLDGSFRLPQSI